jgi:hypothetical protein
MLAPLALLPLCGWIGWTLATSNFAVLQPGRIYRSAQMSPLALSQTLHAYQVKTVVNLRGPNPEQDWYRGELAATLAAGATHDDIALSSCVWMSRIQLRTLVEVLDSCEYPILLHCSWGAERTGLTSAIAELLRPGATLDDARSQLALRYLYLRLGDGRIMAEFLDQYEGWLRANHRHHSPADFRTWVAEAYRPGEPSREAWPYDPDPLCVITRPVPPPQDLIERQAAGTAPTLTR